MYADDLADALVFLLRHYNQSGQINVGSGEEVSIAKLAEMIGKVVGYTGEFSFAPDKPDGSPRKLADSSRLKAMGWQPQTRLVEGLQSTYRWYLDSIQRR